MCCTDKLLICFQPNLKRPGELRFFLARTDHISGWVSSFFVYTWNKKNDSVIKHAAKTQNPLYGLDGWVDDVHGLRIVRDDLRVLLSLPQKCF